MLASSKCIVTGASSGIGRGTCEVLTREGAKVIGIGRNELALKKLKEEGHIYDYIVIDLTLEGAAKKVIEKAVMMMMQNEEVDGDGNGDGTPKLTSLVNCAGVLKGGAMGDANVDVLNYHANMTTNVQAPFELMVHAIPYLKETASASASTSTLTSASVSASIVNISSVNAKQSFPGCVTYCMSKAALDQLTRCSSVDLAKYGIRVNSVNPGVIETNLQKTGGLSEQEYETFLKRSIEHTHPLAKSLGRVGQPNEVGELVAFLLSDKAKFITGECIAIDGGRQNLGAR